MSKEDFADIKAYSKEQYDLRRKQALEEADPTGWTQHTQWHWSRQVEGERIDYWPSKRKWRFRNHTYYGMLDRLKLKITSSLNP